MQWLLLMVFTFCDILGFQKCKPLQITTIFQETIEGGDIGLVHYTVNNIHIWQYRVIDGSYIEIVLTDLFLNNKNGAY